MIARGSEGLLRRLVGFDTTSLSPNLPLVHFIRDYLDTHGVRSRIVKAGLGCQANLLASIGPADRPGILLSGHMDVVPVDSQAWTSDPFCVVRRGDRFYGRGCADMKGFLASVLAAVPLMVESPLRVPMHLAFTYDEEVGCAGVRHLLEVLDQLPITPVMGIVGEPTSMHVAIGHKGKIAYRVRVRGRAGHSSDPTDSVNAVEYAARIIAFIADLNDEKRQRGPFRTGYDVPYTTLHVGSVHGGAALNIVPAECVFEFEVRHIPEEFPRPLVERIHAFVAAHLEPAMRRVNPESGVEFDERIAYPGLSTDPDADVVAFVQSLLDVKRVPTRVAFGTEAGLFHEHCGIPMVICGPGSMTDAHKANESIGVDQLEACDAFMNRLVMRLRADVHDA
jgi:acetylornithine deacetylase